MIHRRTAPVLGAPIDVTGPDDVLARIALWANQRESRVVCFCNAHTVTCYGRDPSVAKAILHADLAAPDGALVVWTLRLLGHRGQPRITARDLMLPLLDQAQANQHAVFLLGGTRQSLSTLRKRLRARLPSLQLVGALAPPPRPLTRDEDARVVQHIQRSGAQIVFVAMDCPGQELWMAEHRGRIPAVMLGVGPAVDFHAEALSRAPRWMRRLGLGWVRRLAPKARHAPWRSVGTGAVFVARAAWQLLTRSVRAA